MILSVYLGRGFVSAVLFNTEPFSVKSKAFVDIAYEADAFFAFTTYKHLESIICDKLQISSEEYATATKILVKSNSSTPEIQGWLTSNSLQQILDSVAGRIFLFSEENLENYFNSDTAKLNDYANRNMYHKRLEIGQLTDAISSEAQKFWKAYDAPKITLREVIFSCYKYSIDEQKKIEETLRLNLTSSCKTNKIIEITFDYGFFLIPIIAALIQQKKDPKEFFTQNPIHVDSKLVVIPAMDDQLEYQDQKGELITDIEVVNKLTNIKVEEGDTVTIKSKNPKKKVHLELLGCKDGIFVDTSTKTNEK